MAKIRADHSKFSAASSAIKKYTNSMDRFTLDTAEDIALLVSTWQGKDQNSFAQSWNKAINNKSIHAKMKNSLVNYANVLDYASKLYKQAQADAINRANSL